MTTSTPRAGLNRLLNHLAALALLLMVAAGASAQTIFVDSDGGSDTFEGTQPTVSGTNGPVATLGRAIQLAAGGDGSRDLISIEAGDYNADLDIENSGMSTTLNGVTFQARPDQAGNTEVNLNVGGGEFLVAVDGFAFTSTGGGMFEFNGSGSVDFEDGSVDFGSNVVSLNLAGGASVVERTNADVTGSVTYTALPGTIRFNGDGDVMAGTLLPSTVDIAAGSVLIDIALGSVAATINDNERVLTLASGLTLGDDGGNVGVSLRDGNRIAGAITTVDGSGADGTGSVTIFGEGSIGDLVVDGGQTNFDLDEGDADADADNVAGSITVISGNLNFPDDGNAAAAERFRVTGNFTQTGGTVTAGDADQTIFVVEGDFTRSSNVAGNFAALNLYLEGTDDAAFSPGTNLTLNSVHINATPNSATNEKMVTFFQDITVNSGATGTNAAGNIIPFIVTDDADVDLNGNLVNVTLGGESIVDGTVSDVSNDGAIRFTGGGVASGTGTYSSIIVDGPTVNADDAFTFTNTLNLLNGGLNIVGTDVSPEGDNAAVSVNIAAANPPQITGPFNGDNEEYDLTYGDTNNANDIQPFTADSEFDTDNIRNLEVDVTNAAILVPLTAEDGTISGNVIVRNGQTSAVVVGPNNAQLIFQGQDVVVGGSTTVEDNALISLAPNAGDEASYAVSTAGNVLDGTFVGSPGSALILQDGATITGTQTTTTGTATATTESTISTPIVLADGATASLLQIRVINGDITDEATAAADGGSLTIGLIADNDATPGDFDQEENGDINGDLELSHSTLVLASSVHLTAVGEDIVVSTLNTQGNVFFLEGPTALDILNDVMGTGAVWPSSDAITINGDDNNAITIPTFHPGDENSDDTNIAADITVTNVLRLTGILDAENSDGGTAATDYAVIVDSGSDTTAVTLVFDDGYTIASDGTNEPEATADQELVINSDVNLTTNEVGTVNSYTEFVLATEDVQTFTVNDEAEFDVSSDETYTVVDFVTSDGASLDLQSNNLQVSGDASFAEDDALFNGAAAGSRLVGGTVNPSYSTFSFVGGGNSTLMVTPDETSGVTTFGDGVDLRVAKDTTSATVTLTGGSLVFDDEFDTGIADDETLILDTGVLVVSDGNYIRLDHTNRISASASSDDGQGFVFTPRETQFPMSWIDGDVRKRIISDPSLFAGDLSPGRVVYPVGTADAEDGEGYAEYVLDFESISQSQSFGQRSVTVSFEDMAPGGTLGLPIELDADSDTDGDGDIDADDEGLSISDYGNFFWLVRSNPNLGSGTFFNVEARYDGFELRTGTTAGFDETINDLVLLQRQSGNATQNPYTLASATFANFILQDDGDDEEPVVVAQNVEALLGGQGTIFTFGLATENRPVATDDTPVPTEFVVRGAQPNPFGAQTSLRFDLPEAADVTVQVFDVMGRRVMDLNMGTVAAGANQSVEIDGASLASGVYVYRLTAAGVSETWTKGGQITLAR